jgi:hypothetical protein
VPQMIAPTLTIKDKLAYKATLRTVARAFRLHFKALTHPHPCRAAGTPRLHLAALLYYDGGRLASKALRTTPEEALKLKQTAASRLRADLDFRARHRTLQSLIRRQLS